MEKERKKWRLEKEKNDLIESVPRTTQSRKLKPTIQVNCEPKLDRAQDRLSPKIQLWGSTNDLVSFDTKYIFISQNLFTKDGIYSQKKI